MFFASSFSSCSACLLFPSVNWSLSVVPTVEYPVCCLRYTSTKRFLFVFSSFVSSVLFDSVRVNLGESLCSLVLLDGVAFVSLLIL